MATSKHNPILSRRTALANLAAFPAAIALSAIPAVALAESENANDEKIELLSKPLAILGRALADGRLRSHDHQHRRKLGKPGATFHLTLEGDDYLNFMSAAFAGLVIAGLYTKEQVIAKLENIQEQAA